ncbi:hypothetical protein Y032_0163g3474 [Ancylostoma ceylanicum]|uniref:Uncharacterized protein n=1 Tax=Ancylostoma ceylanicum TaxID=53326 RepID=A0A016SXT3_9BILA|nr:hypothetical protein Y032_0163g3474 [Ancylostoma ceylanicum]
MNSCLITLRSVHANAPKGKSTRRTPQYLGFLEFAMNSEKSRTQWEMGIIFYVDSDADGNVRSVDVRCSNGNTAALSINMFIPREVVISNDSEGVHVEDVERVRTQKNKQTKEGLRIQAS